jgi:ATP-dependent Clp protease ATP-binding subunit ClpC
MDELKKTFRPEFLNRLDEIIVFKKLDKEAIYKITELMLNDVKERLEQKNIKVEFSKNVIEFISKVGFDEIYGARPLRRAIQNRIEDFLAEEILDGNINSSDKIKLDVENEKIVISKL